MAVTIKDRVHRGDLTFIMAMVVAVIMPVHVKFLPPFMVLWGLLWLWENNFKIKGRMFLENKAAILFFIFIGFYLWQITGLLLADLPGSGFERILKRLSFLLFPLVLFYPGVRIVKNIKLIIRIFAISTFLYLIFCFGQALYNSFFFSGGSLIFNPHPVDYDWDNYFYSTYFSYPLHPSYVAIYVILSLLISFEALFDTTVSGRYKYLWVSVTLVLMTGLYFLSSRSGFLSAGIVFSLYFFLKLTGKISVWIILASLVIFILILTGIVRMNHRISSSIKELPERTLFASFGDDTRSSIWKSAVSVSQKNLLFGVGTGDASAELKKEFIRQGFNEGYYEDLNAHNQFLEILLENGLIGLVIFLCIPAYMIFLAFSESNILLGLFVIMMLIFFLFETILNRIAGVTFFPLFSFLLLYYRDKIA